MLEKKLADAMNCEMSQIKGLEGGEMRQTKGELVERWFKRLVRTTWVEKIGGDPKRLTLSKLKIPYSYEPDESNESKLLYAKIAASQKESHGIGLDAFVYIDGRLVMGGESKSYCDKSMYKRAQGEFESLVAIDTSVRLVVFQAENALGGKIHEKAVCNLATDQHLLSEGMIHYLMNRKRICKVSPETTVLTLTGDRRCSTKDISKKESPVTAERIDNIVDFFKKTLGSYV